MVSWHGRVASCSANISTRRISRARPDRVSIAKACGTLRYGGGGILPAGGGGGTVRDGWHFLQHVENCRVNSVHKRNCIINVF